MILKLKWYHVYMSSRFTELTQLQMKYMSFWKFLTREWKFKILIKIPRNVYVNMDYQVKDNNCSFFYHCEWLFKTTRIWSFFDVWTFHVTPNCISLSNSRFILTFRYCMTYQFKRNPSTIPEIRFQCWPLLVAT
jgi:hypothetical protein